MKIACSALFLAWSAAILSAQSARTVFAGVPSLRVVEAVVSRSVEELGREKGLERRCVISKIGENYYWASNDNALLVRTDGGAFITFTPVGKAGYIRVIAPGSKETASMLGPAERQFDYVEHGVSGLTGVTYWGRIESPPDALYNVR